MFSNLLTQIGKLTQGKATFALGQSQKRLITSQKIPLPEKWDFRPPTQIKVKKDPEVEYWHNQRETSTLYFYWTWARVRFAVYSGVLAPVGMFYVGSMHHQNQAADMTGNVPEAVFGLESRPLNRPSQEVAKETYASATGPDTLSRLYTYYRQQFWSKEKRESRTEIL